MNNGSAFNAHHLRFEVETTTTMALPPPVGPKLRAALYQAMSMVCPLRADVSAPPEHKADCPVCWLLATEKPGDRQGKDLPRPMTVEPPLKLERCNLEPGERFVFGLTLFAQAANLFPYLALGVPEMGRLGLGRQLPELGGERGRFVLRRAEALNPLTQERQLLLDAAQGPLFRTPSIPVTGAQVSEWANRQVREITIEFLTPTRIVSERRLVRRPLFRPLFARLFDRLRALNKHYAAGEPAPGDVRLELLALAEQVQLVSESIRWDDSHSYSSRLKHSTPIGGFVGQAVYQAQPEVWRPLLPYLLWGQSTHVGKSATKGSGWYKMTPP